MQQWTGVEKHPNHEEYHEQSPVNRIQRVFTGAAPHTIPTGGECDGNATARN